MIYRGRSEREGDRTGLSPGKSLLPSLLECSPSQAGEGRLTPLNLSLAGVQEGPRCGTPQVLSYGAQVRTRLGQTAGKAGSRT